jgi:hypothetical protein
MAKQAVTREVGCAYSLDGDMLDVLLEPQFAVKEIVNNTVTGLIASLMDERQPRQTVRVGVTVGLLREVPDGEADDVSAR